MDRMILALCLVMFACTPTKEVVEVEQVVPGPAYSGWQFTVVAKERFGFTVYAIHPPPLLYEEDCIYYLVTRGARVSPMLLDKICKGEWNERD